MLVEPPDRLNSWKEIADFLKCHEKTARRWEKSRRLPVHRVPGGAKSSVIAYRAEIESWLRSAPTEESSPISDDSSRLIADSAAPLPDSELLLTTAHKTVPRRILWALASSLMLAGAFAGVATRKVWQRSHIRLVGNPKGLALFTVAVLPPLIADASRLYVQSSALGRLGMIQISPVSGSWGALDIALHNPDPGVVAPDGSAMLLRDIQGNGKGDEPLFIQPLPTGKPGRLGEIVAYDSAWTPDRRHIVFSKLNSVYESTADGTVTRKLFDLSAKAYHFRFSPTGWLRFSVYDSTTNAYRIWEAASLSSPPHAISFGIEALAPHQCCGSWNKDGSIYFFQGLVNGFWQIFAQPGNQGIFVRGSYTADQLTTGLVQYSSPVASPDSDRLYVLSQSHKSEVVRYDLATQQWTPIAEGVPADTAAFSKDGKSQAFTRMPDHTLWRCSMPGCTSPVQLTFAPVRATMPRWSPNGQKIACMTRTAGGAWQATLISVAGGPAFHIPAGAGAADPSWSPEGNRIAFAAVPGQNQRSAQPIQIYNMGKKVTTEIRGSEGYDSPLWSPDGLFLAAVRSDSRELAFYEFSTGKWRHSPGTRAGYLNWSSDSKRVYFLSPAGEESRRGPVRNPPPGIRVWGMDRFGPFGFAARPA
jgi:WD40 repeat protein